jgi:hypothetical protein
MSERHSQRPRRKQSVQHSVQETLTWLDDTVARVGWAVTSIMPSEDTPLPQRVPWSYTTGFWLTYGQPEVIVFALRPEIAQHLLTDLVELFKSPLKLADGKKVEHLANLPVVFKAAPTEHRVFPMNMTNRFYERLQKGGDGYPALQMVLTDARGLFPWDPGCDELMLRSQTMIRTFEPGTYVEE